MRRTNGLCSEARETTRAQPGCAGDSADGKDSASRATQDGDPPLNPPPAAGKPSVEGNGAEGGRDGRYYKGTGWLAGRQPTPESPPVEGNGIARDTTELGWAGDSPRYTGTRAGARYTVQSGCSVLVVLQGESGRLIVAVMVAPKCG